MNGRQSIDLFLERCAELISSDPAPTVPPPAVQVPLMTYPDFCEFIYYSIHGDSSPLNGDRPKTEAGKEKLTKLKEKLATLATPNDVALLTETDIQSLFKEAFSQPLLYARRTFKTVDHLSSNVIDPDEVVKVAEPFIRHLIAKGYTVRYLADIIKHMQGTFVSPELDLLSFMNALNTDLSGGDHTFDVYCIRILGAGGQDRGFKSFSWGGLPEPVRDRLLDHVVATQVYDATEPESRKRLNQIYTVELQETRYINKQYEAVDPYAAVENFLNDYLEMKSIVYMTRKKKSSGKNQHSIGRNTGGSPVRLGDVFIVIRRDTGEEQQILHPIDNRVTFPYQKLKLDAERVRELADLYFNKCEVFRQLSLSYANALEAFQDNRVDDIFRNLGIATDLAFRPHFGPDRSTQASTDESRKASTSFRQEGAILMALDWLRGQFEWMTRNVKELYHGKSEGHTGITIEDIILEDRHWEFYKDQFPLIMRWRRDQVILVLRSLSKDSHGSGLHKVKERYDSEFRILLLARNQYAHSTRIFRDRYFMALLLEFFRVVLDFRFSCYTVWLEHQLGRRVRTKDMVFDDIAEKFSGWEDEFAARVREIGKDYEEIRMGRREHKSLVLGAGYADFGRKPSDEGLVPLLSRTS